MPPSPPASSSAYRNPTVEEDEDDDLDDLDDVLASFNKPAAQASKPAAPQNVKTDIGSSSSGAAVDDEDFEASLVEGMESLLRQLAGDNPPGLMADENGTKSTAGPSGASTESSIPPGLSGPPGSMSKEEEEQAWQKAIEMMLSGEGLDALGLDASGNAKPSGSAPPRPSSSKTEPESERGAKEEKPDFNETIRRTMEQLKQGGSSSQQSAGGGDLAALLAELGADPSALNGLGEGDDDLSGLLDGMMAQLMNKEVLEEPMSELAAKYPAYLASPPPTVSPADLEKYSRQHELVKQILAVFKKPDYSDEEDGKEVGRLVGEMQDLGGPPQEIMGDLPEGFDLGALGAGGEDGCTIM